MTELSPRARQLLTQYKAAAAMPAGDKERLLANLDQAFRRGALPRFDVPVPALVVPSASWPRRAWSSPVARALIAGSLVGVPALAAIGIVKLREPVAVERRLPSVSAAPLLFNEEAAAATPTPIELPDLELPEKRGVEPPRAIPRSLPTIASTPSRAPALESTIDAEMRLLTDAQAANQAGDPRRALQLLDEFALRFPASRLTDVRTVARLVALCKVGQADLARREAARFLAKYPNSPFQDRVRGICASKVKP